MKEKTFCLSFQERLNWAAAKKRYDQKIKGHNLRRFKAGKPPIRLRHLEHELKNLKNSKIRK